MKTSFVVGGMMLATVLCSVVFWRFVMPRFATRKISKRLGLLLTFVFAVTSIGILVGSYFLLPQPSFMLGGLLVIAWCLAVRASTWFMGRKYVAPVLMKSDAKSRM